MHRIEDFIYNYEGKQRELLEYFHNLMMSYPEINSKIAYKIPFYYRKSRICYLNPLKSGEIEFAFIRGNELSNIQELLQVKNRKLVRSITFSQIKEIPTESIVG